MENKWEKQLYAGDKFIVDGGPLSDFLVIFEVKSIAWPWKNGVGPVDVEVSVMRKKDEEHDRLLKKYNKLKDELVKIEELARISRDL